MKKGGGKKKLNKITPGKKNKTNHTLMFIIITHQRDSRLEETETLAPHRPRNDTQFPGKFCIHHQNVINFVGYRVIFVF